MPARTARATWEGSVMDGKGTITAESGAVDAASSLAARAGEGASATNPEELIAAAHAGCFAMQLSALLTQAGNPPERIDATAKVHLFKVDPGFRIKRIDLNVRARVPGIDEDTFRQTAQQAKETCPVSVALGGVDEITLEASLES